MSDSTMDELKHNHAFVICAYKQSPYLQECIDSLRAQTVQSPIKIATSMPSDWLREVAERNVIPLAVNPIHIGMADDFNFALSQGNAEFVTLCHQDDIYEPLYTVSILEAIHRAKEPIIAFSDYYELREGGRVDANRLLIIKRLMNFPLRSPFLWNARWVRRTILRFGNPICCPSVTFVMTQAVDPVFDVGFKNNMDYKAWVDLSPRKGSFVHCPQRLMGHRIHEESGTTQHIHDNSRGEEDLRVLSLLWPVPIAKAVFRFYRKAQQSNQF